MNKLEELKKVKPDSDADFNILIAHGSVIGIKEFSMHLSGILRIKSQEQPFMRFPLPAFYIPFKFDISFEFSNPKIKKTTEAMIK